MKQGDDVFGVISNAMTMKDEVVIIKSKARKLCVERDGMSDEDFEEHWDYNIAGAKGQGQYSVVDDEIPIEVLEEMLDSDDELINPPAEV